MGRRAAGERQGTVSGNVFVHFEIPADDVERAKAFYEALFDWKITEMPGFPGYWGVRVSDDDNDLHGAMQARQDDAPTPLFYVAVESVDDTVARLEALGGTVMMPKSPVPGMGWLAIFRDPEGNRFGLWQMDPNAG